MFIKDGKLFQIENESQNRLYWIYVASVSAPELTGTSLLSVTGWPVGSLPVVQAAGPIPSLEAIGTGPLLGTTFNAEADCLHSGRQFRISLSRRVDWVVGPHFLRAGPFPAHLRVQDLHCLEGGGETEVAKITGGLLQIIEQLLAEVVVRSVWHVVHLTTAAFFHVPRDV
jgi:hypothetical protein